jgi:uncharacterized protein with HEPN domain
MKKNPDERFYHIREAIDNIISFEPIDLANIKEYSAVVYQLQIIGEAIKHATPAIKNKYQEIPWAKISTFRNYAVHEYFMLDTEAIREALRQLPGILKSINKIIDELES